MSKAYAYGVTCRNPACQHHGVPTTITVNLAGKVETPEAAITILNGILWEYQYYECQQCHRIYRYSSRDVFAFIPREASSGIKIESGKRESPRTRKEF